jgi:hypothetical protein
MPQDLPDHDYGGVSYGADSHNDHTKSWKTGTCHNFMPSCSRRVA